LDYDATRERRERGGGGLAFNLHPVGARMGVARIGEHVRERAVVAEQQQSFAVGIEAADRIDVAHRHEIPQGTMARFGHEA
jgi:hypothetical protein